MSGKNFGVLKHALNLSVSQNIFSENIKIAGVTPVFKSGDEYLLIRGLPQHCHVSQKS